MVVGRTDEERPLSRTEQLDGSASQLLGDRRRAGPADRGEGGERREPKGLSPRHLDFGKAVGVTQHGSQEHFVAGKPRLYDHAPGHASDASTHEAAGPYQQRQRLLGRAVARREQLAVEVEEHHGIGVVDAVEQRFGADEHIDTVRNRTGVRSHLGHRPLCECLDLLTGPGDAHTHVVQPSAPADETQHGTLVTASPAGEHTRVRILLHRTAATLAACDLPARAAGQHLRPPGPVQHQEHRALGAHDRTDGCRQKSLTTGLLAGAVDHVERRPPAPFVAAGRNDEARPMVSDAVRLAHRKSHHGRARRHQ